MSREVATWMYVREGGYYGVCIEASAAPSYASIRSIEKGEERRLAVFACNGNEAEVIVATYRG